LVTESDRAIGANFIDNLDEGARSVERRCRVKMIRADLGADMKKHSVTGCIVGFLKSRYLGRSGLYLRQMTCMEAWYWNLRAVWLHWRSVEDMACINLRGAGKRCTKSRRDKAVVAPLK
jgi:hypothetical protein